jgi:hypothetical protein
LEVDIKLSTQYGASRFDHYLYDVEQVPKLAIPGPSNGSKTARGDQDRDKQAEIELVTFKPALVLSARTHRHQGGDVVRAWQADISSQDVEIDEENLPRLEQLQAEFRRPRLFAVWSTLTLC